MKRRTLLGAAALAAVPAGCLGDSQTEDPESTNGDDNPSSDANPSSEDDNAASDGDPPNDADHYERCENRIVIVSRLPDPANTEVMEAIEEGASGGEGPLAIEGVMRVDEAYLRHEGTYYRPDISREGDETQLALVESRPTFEEPVTLENMRDEGVSVDVRIEHDETGDVVFDEVLELDPDELITVNEDVEFPYGTYHASVDGDGISETLSWELDQRFESGYDYPLELDDNGLFSDPVDTDSSEGPCSWDDDGSVSTGH